MKFYETEESKRKMTDRKAKMAAKQRMKQRGIRKLIWFFVIVIALAAFYFTVGQSTVVPWVSDQVSGATKKSVGTAKGTAGIFERRDVKEAKEDLDEDLEY